MPIGLAEQCNGDGEEDFPSYQQGCDDDGLVRKVEEWKNGDSDPTCQYDAE